MSIFKMLAVLLAIVALLGCSPASTTLPEATPIQEILVQPDLDTPTLERLPSTAPVLPTTAPTITAAPPATPTLAPPTALPEPATQLFSYPIGTPGRPLGDGFFVRHGVAVENTWYNPGYWHTGEDWYAIDGDTAGAQVYAIANGEVVYAGANYPGRVVIVRHADDLYSMYGHLDPALNVKVGQSVTRGELIGMVLRRGDATPNHLHFEIRTFLQTNAVNGSAPRYGFRCGVNCPPGPGYWPIDAPDVPSDLGWRNPTHVIARRMFLADPGMPLGQVAVASHPISQTITLWSAPPDASDRAALGMLDLHPGERFALIAVNVGAEDTNQTSALAYRLWYHIMLPDGRAAWVQAAIPSTFETGSDGRPSSVYFNFFPVLH